MYDYGARNYDPSIGRFHNMDRFSEKYLGFSPYSYAGNNPIALLDIQGDSIGLGKNHYDRIVNEVESQTTDIYNSRKDRKNKIEQARNSGKMRKASRLEKRDSKKSDDEKKRLDVLKQTAFELNELKKSDIIYDLKTNVKSGGEGAGGYLGFDEGRNSVTINVAGGFHLGDFMHELKHGYQFETGAISLYVVNGTIVGGDLYDVQDEVEAYARGAFFGGRSSSEEQIMLDYPGLINKPTQRNYLNTQVSPTVTSKFRINGVTTGLITVNHYYNKSLK